jgi:hypothetical protein
MASLRARLAAVRAATAAIRPALARFYEALDASRHQAASAGRTRLAISAPRSRSITAMSYWLCRSSQNCARFPK